MKNLKLKSARASFDMSQQELADKVGVSRQTINAIEKGATSAKYAKIWQVQNSGAWKCVTGCKTVGDWAKAVLGIEKGTATDYLDTMRTFYTMDDNGICTIVNDLFEGVSLSNLKEMKALYKSDSKKLITAITNGEVHLNISQTKLRAELKALSAELPKQDEPKQDEPKQDEPKQDSTPIEKDPKTEATRYNDMAMGYALELCKEDKEKCDKIVELYNQLAALLSEC